MININRTWADYSWANEQLNEGLIRVERTDPDWDPRPDDLEERLHMRLLQRKAFFAEVGNPQLGIPVVHVTGTSGKGSTCLLIACQLQKLGWRVALHVTPYLQSATEKVWIDGRYLDGTNFRNHLEALLPIAQKWKDDPATIPSIHGMTSVALFFRAAAAAKVDAIVLEAGCGARYDLTNVDGMEVITSVVTNVGADHLKTLGGSLESIAWHKAGVIKPRVPCVSGVEAPLNDIIRREAVQLGSSLMEKPGANNQELARNATHLADAELSKRSMVKGFQGLKFPDNLPGRQEQWHYRGMPVVLDGAHNGPKVQWLTTWLKKSGLPGPFTVVFGCLSAKDSSAMIEALLPIIDCWVLAPPSPYGKPPMQIDQLHTLIADIGAQVVTENQPQHALDQAVALARSCGTIVVTGSMYLVGEIRELFISTRQIVERRCSFQVHK